MQEYRKYGLCACVKDSNREEQSLHLMNWYASGVRRKKFRGGLKVMAGLVGGPGAEPPGRRKIVENIQQNFLIKLKNELF